MRELRHAAWERQGGVCAVVGAPLGDPDDDRWDLHHRLVVDGRAGRSIHTDPAWSRPLGLLLSANRGDDPARVPVRLAGRGWVFLTDDGGCLPVA
jgi:hypothetical protein